MSAAMQIEMCAARYLARRQKPEWSAADQAELDAWLDESTAHAVAYWRLEHGWQKADRLAVLRSAAPLQIAPVSRNRRPWVWVWGGSLAAALAMVSLLLWHSSALSVRTYTTRIGGHQTVPLRDGSHLELNTDTRVRTEVNGRSRTVWVDRGEVYFDVARDTSRPFVVFTGPNRVTVLGTKFSVRRDADRVRIAVTEGRVQIEEMGAAVSLPPRVIQNGELAIAEGRKLRVESSAAEKLAQQLSWRQGVLIFDHTTLAEASAEFNRYNHTQLVVADSAANVSIGGSFEAANLEAFVRILQQGFGLQAAEHDGRILLGKR